MPARLRTIYWYAVHHSKGASLEAMARGEIIYPDLSRAVPLLPPQSG